VASREIQDFYVLSTTWNIHIPDLKGSPLIDVDRPSFCNPAHRFPKMPIEGIKWHTQSDYGDLSRFFSMKRLYLSWIGLLTLKRNGLGEHIPRDSIAYSLDIRVNFDSD
jgi:hypothetical protein